jgi:hypothetical protein
VSVEGATGSRTDHRQTIIGGQFATFLFLSQIRIPRRMSLFEVTGFNLPAGPPAPDNSHSSNNNNNKRKRPRPHDAVEPSSTAAVNGDHAGASTTTGPEINVEKLLEKMRKAEKGGKPQPKDNNNKGKKKAAAPATDRRDRPNGRNEEEREGGGKGKKNAGRSGHQQTQTAASSSAPPAASDAPPASKKQKKRRLSDSVDTQADREPPATTVAKKPETRDGPEKSDKKKKRKENKKKERKQGTQEEATEQKQEPEPSEESPPAAAAPVEEAKQPAGSGMTELQKKMRSKLHGSRFRWINEQLVCIFCHCLRSSALLTVDETVYGHRKRSAHPHEGRSVHVRRSASLCL